MYARKAKVNLASSYHVVVRDFVLSAHIGVDEEERSRAQAIRINVELSIMPPDCPFRDQADLILNYDIVLDRIRDAVNHGACHLIETLADKIASRCLLLAHVQTVRLCIEKVRIEPHAVGVVLEYRRAE